MAAGETRIWVDEGLLVWDGSVLELFRNDGKTGAWRLHALTVQRWEAQALRGERSLLKIWDSAKHYEAATVATTQLVAMTAVMAEIESTR
jgi:hypothetical protein